MENTAGKTVNPGKKRIVAAVCAAAAVALLAVAFLLCRNSIFYSAAKKNIRKEDFKAAQTALESVKTEKGQVLRDYATLRVEINSRYASLIASFDIDEVRKWEKEAGEIESRSSFLPDDVRPKATALYQKLSTICTLYDDFGKIQPGITEMMDVFDEINRLYSKDESGKNTPFTLDEEEQKIRSWTALHDSAYNYSIRLPGRNPVYLFSFLLKETQGELEDLKKLTEKIKQQGYGPADTVRINGDGRKSFPSVSSSDGTVLNFARKDEYVQYLFKGVCRSLAESLAEYYIGF